MLMAGTVGEREDGQIERVANWHMYMTMYKIAC